MHGAIHGANFLDHLHEESRASWNFELSIS